MTCVGSLHSRMLSELSCSCERCDAPLGDAQRRLTMATDAGTRVAYECDCGAITVAVSREATTHRRH